MKATPLEGSPEVTPEHYLTPEYNSKARICSYWHQVDELRRLGAANLLEVGPGSGFVTDWLRREGFAVRTLDADAQLSPDITGSVTEIPLEAGAVDAVLCCQVLEHLPFEQLVPALREMRRVSTLGAVVSLPDVSPWLGIAYPLYFGLYADRVRQRLPGGAGRGLLDVLRRRIRLRDYLFARLVPVEWSLGDRTWEARRAPIPHGPLTPRDFGPEGESHVFEIGMEGYPVERVRDAFGEAGLKLLHEFRVPENPWHHFFTAGARD